MQTLIQAKPTHSARFWFIGACVLGFVLFLALLAYVFMRYPESRLSTSTGPKANIPVWFGANGAGIAYMLFGLLIACLYVYVSVQGTSGPGVWRYGVLLGVQLGAAWFVIMPIVAGALATRYTRRLGSGPLASFWCGVTAALLIA